MANSYGSEGALEVGEQKFTVYRLNALAKQFPGAERLPCSLKVLLENLLRTENGHSVRAEDIEALSTWDSASEPNREIAFTPSRVLHQDFTGVPSIVDLAAMRDAMKRLGGNPRRINPLQPVELVIDHSVQVDDYGNANAFKKNGELEFARNHERYLFLRWGQKTFANFRVVPPQTGIVHQVNLEYLARVVFTDRSKPYPKAYPDSLVGTDSHTTMVNGLGVLGWGCGGIEAEAVMLGQPVSMLIPQVIGFKVTGHLPEAATATDLVLTITERLRKRSVVGKFVEFFGDGLASLSLADRATVANMAPEYGATCGFFPIDEETLRYMRLTGRPDGLVKLVETYAKDQGLFHTASTPEARYTDTLSLDLGSVEPSMAGPTRPQDRVRLGDVRKSFLDSVSVLHGNSKKQPKVTVQEETRIVAEGGGGAALGAHDGLAAMQAAQSSAAFAHAAHEVKDGSVVIAAITSCTNTSNPALLFAAGLLAQKAVERGLSTKPWVKPSLAPGSKVVTEYLTKAGLMPALEELKFYLAGYGCTTCVGNSGPLQPAISKAIADGELVVAAVLSGNRNFEGRVHPDVRANYLASPPLVVAYALAGRMDIDLTNDPIGNDKAGKPVFLRDIWPSSKEVAATIDRALDATMFKKVYDDVFTGDERWGSLAIPEGELYEWRESTYIKNPPYFVDMTVTPPPARPIAGARVLALLGDSITTDHISPAGAIKVDGPAGKYLIAHGVAPKDFNAYGSRRGNHEVMVRGTFANIRLRNRIAPGTEGGFTRHFPDGEGMTIFDASVKYQAEKTPLLVIAGKEYGTGSSRDWAAKGTLLLGVRAVIAESFERIHRSNLIGMGVAPLQFAPGDGAVTLGLAGDEVYEIVDLAKAITNGVGKGREVTVRAARPDGITREFTVTVRIDTPQEVQYYLHGGILQYVLRQLLRADHPA
jgi:aconitate hydratase